MVKYIEFINSDSMLKADPLLRAACAHFYLAMIHPFRDGNGRTARFVEAWLLNNSVYRLLAASALKLLLSEHRCLFLRFFRDKKTEKYDTVLQVLS